MSSQLFLVSILLHFMIINVHIIIYKPYVIFSYNIVERGLFTILSVLYYLLKLSAFFHNVKVFVCKYTLDIREKMYVLERKW